MQRELRRLVDAELVYQRGMPPRATYLFKHALIQDAAYQSLLRSTRQQYHQRIAQVLEEGIALYDPSQHRSLAFLYGEDPGVVCLSFAAWALVWLGSPDQALQRNREALRLPQEHTHSHSLARALGIAAFFHQLRQEEQATQEWAEAGITLATKQGFPHWTTTGTMLQGWALAKQGKGAEGIAQRRQGLSAHEATGAELGRP